MWNGKGARYNPTNQRLVFETFRADIIGGSIIPPPGKIKASGVNNFYLAGPETGSEDRSGHDGSVCPQQKWPGCLLYRMRRRERRRWGYKNISC